MERSSYVNGCIWVACAIIIVGFVTVLFVGRIGETNRITGEIERGYPVHDVYVAFVGDSVAWTTNDNVNRCTGRYRPRTGLVVNQCKEIVRKSVEELREDG